MKKQYYIVLLSLLTLFLNACTARIDIRTEDAPERLIIYGYITTDTTAHCIQITRSTGYFATTRPPAVSGAEVIISSEDEYYILKESTDDPGCYFTQEDVYGTEGKTYQLQVLADFYGDGNAQEYKATSLLPYSVEIDTITLKESEVFDDRIDIYFYGRLPETEPNYMSFHAYKNDVLLNDSLSLFSVIDDEYISGKELEEVSCYSLDQEEERSLLEIGDKVTLQVNSITKEYYEFIRDAQSELYGSNPLFGGPPANIQTNIYPISTDNNIPVSGFFTAYSLKKKSTVYERNMP